MSPNIAIHVETQSHSMGIPSPGSVRSTGSRRNSPAVSKIFPPEPSSSSPTAGELGKCDKSMTIM